MIPLADMQNLSLHSPIAKPMGILGHLKFIFFDELIIILLLQNYVCMTFKQLSINYKNLIWGIAWWKFSIFNKIHTPPTTANLKNE